MNLLIVYENVIKLLKMKKIILKHGVEKDKLE